MKIDKKFLEICKQCGKCNTHACFAIQDDINKSKMLPDKIPTTYGNGIRFTSDAMDCALPISFDSHSGCSYSCLYCFSNNLMRSPDKSVKDIKQAIKEGKFYTEYPIKHIERFLNREPAIHGLPKENAQAMYKLINNKQPIQLGALGDPFDELEEHSGWAKKALKLFIKYEQPVRISTKGALLLQKREYLRIIEKAPHLFWFAFSCISNSDDIIGRVDIGAPVTTERLKAMKILSKIGCKTSLRFRPFIPGMSDAYPGEPEAYRVLMERSAEAGANAVSFEYIFLNSAPTGRLKGMYNLMWHEIGDPTLGDRWNASSKSIESCRRGSRHEKFAMTMNIRRVAHKLGMVFGCSDPHFKEYNDTGCCCGILPDDPYFGNWSREQLTNVIVEMHRAHKEGKDYKVSFDDWCPQWARDVKLASMVSLRDWHTHRLKKNVTFADQMRNKWNTPTAPRSPYIYFGGVMEPVGVEKKTEDVIYRYKSWDRDFEEDELIPNF